jgi:signal transduction histidine kinase
MGRPRISSVAAGLLVAGGVVFAVVGIRALTLEREESQRKAGERARLDLFTAAQDAQRLALKPKGPPAAAWRVEIASAMGAVGRMLSVDDQTRLGAAQAAERAGGVHGRRTAYRKWRELARQGEERWVRQVAALGAGEAGLALGQSDEELAPLFAQAAEALPLLTWEGVRVRLTAMRHLAAAGLRGGRSEPLLTFLDAVQDGERLVQGGVRGPDALLLELADGVARGDLPAPPAPVRRRLEAAARHARLGRRAVAALPRRGGGALLIDDRVALRHGHVLQMRPVSSLVSPLPDEFDAQVRTFVRPPDAVLTSTMTRLAPPLDGVVLEVRTEPTEETGSRLLLALVAGLLIYGLGTGLAIAGMRRRRRAARMQSEFVAAVSHELKTPIASVRAMAEFLTEAGPGDAERLRAYAGRIEAEMRRLGATVHNVLDASQVERQGFVPVHLEPGDPAPVVRELAETVRTDLERRGFDLACEVVPAAAPVLFDADALRGVLVNLLDNAAKFSGREPASVRAIRIEGRPTVGPGPAGYEIAVLDRGPGIDPRKQERLFGRFYRGVEARRGAVPGVGLGLYVARSVIEAHGGRLRAERREGGGSAFRIELRGQQAT